MDILCSFRLVLEGKTGKEIPKSSRFEGVHSSQIEGEGTFLCLASSVNIWQM